MSWEITRIKKPTAKNPVVIIGLPGIGNVGKITVDYIIEKTKAKKVYDFYSETMPHTVYVNEKSLVELPKIELYEHKNLFLLSGDVQPGDEVSCHELCYALLKLFKTLKVSLIVTLGGIGLQELSQSPGMYITGTDKKSIAAFKKGHKINSKLYGIVGPIMGVSGLIMGLGKKKGFDSVSLLVETITHPLHAGFKEAKGLLNILKKKYSIKIDLKDLEKEVKEIEKLKITEDLTQVKQPKSVSYIG